MTSRTPNLKKIPWLEEALRQIPEIGVRLDENWKVEAMCTPEAAELPEWWEASNVVPRPPLTKRACEEYPNPWALWLDVRYLFDTACKRTPADLGLVGRVWRYALWCAVQPRGETVDDDLFTCVACNFLEHVPEIPAAVEDMPNRIPWRDVEAWRDIFSHHAGETGFEAIREVYRRHGRVPDLKPRIRRKHL